MPDSYIPMLIFHLASRNHHQFVSIGVAVVELAVGKAGGASIRKLVIASRPHERAVTTLNALVICVRPMVISGLPPRREESLACGSEWQTRDARQRRVLASSLATDSLLLIRSLSCAMSAPNEIAEAISLVITGATRRGADSAEADPRRREATPKDA